MAGLKLSITNDTLSPHTAVVKLDGIDISRGVMSIDLRLDNNDGGPVVAEIKLAPGEVEIDALYPEMPPYVIGRSVWIGERTSAGLLVVRRSSGEVVYLTDAEAFIQQVTIPDGIDQDG